MDSQWNARYKLQFLISDHLRILSCIKWQWNLYIFYELPFMMQMDSQWYARYKLQFLISDHLRILSCIKWQWNLYIFYELPFIFQVKTWQSEFYRHTNSEITVCLFKIYNHLADVIAVCRSPWNGVPIRHRNYPRRRCELLNAALKYSFTLFILQKNKVLDK